MKWQDVYLYILGLVAIIAFAAVVILFPSESYLQALSKIK